MGMKISCYTFGFVLSSLNSASFSFIYFEAPLWVVYTCMIFISSSNWLCCHYEIFHLISVTFLVLRPAISYIPMAPLYFLIIYLIRISSSNFHIQSACVFVSKVQLLSIAYSWPSPSMWWFFLLIGNFYYYTVWFPYLFLFLFISFFCSSVFIFFQVNEIFFNILFIPLLAI